MITKTLFTLSFCLLALMSVGQSFQGEILYQNSYKSKISNVRDEQFTTMLGSSQKFYIKNGNYKSVTNGQLVLWQTYINKDNKLYTKMSNSDTIFWTDGSLNLDEVLKAEVNKEVVEVLGYKCDELLLTCKNGIHKFYFSNKLHVDSKLFINHKYANWYEFLSRTNAMPLKYTVDYGQFILESVATEIKQIQLDDTIFDLPKNSKTIKSPY
jgi:hypothetical protein